MDGLGNLLNIGSVLFGDEQVLTVVVEWSPPGGSKE
jgi:hypothetical protein